MNQNTMQTKKRKKHRVGTSGCLENLKTWRALGLDLQEDALFWETVLLLLSHEFSF